MRRGFTLIELIAVVIVLALLAGVAVPAFVDYGRRARVSVLTSELKAIRRVVFQYNMDTGEWPSDTANWGDLPSELAGRFDGNPFRASGATQAQYDWNGPPFHAGAGMNVAIRLLDSNPNPTSHAVMLEVDQRLDDGNLSTGLLRWMPSWGLYAWYMTP